jgi:hypothetical protein
MSDALELDQEDFFGRVLASPDLAEVATLLQRKGVTQSDIDTALSVLNERSGKIGACIVVLMPSLVSQSPNSPGPLYNIRMTVQVIEQPLFNLGDTGTGLSAEQIAQHLRVLFHLFANGHGGTYVFDGMEPIAVADGQISYGVSFARKAGDGSAAKVATPEIAADAGTAPANITLTCATAGASIYYTTDGSSYPSSANANATLYTVPFAQATAATIRAVAEKSGLLPSNVRQLDLA